jgi:hypothetical protein
MTTILFFGILMIALVAQTDVAYAQCQRVFIHDEIREVHRGGFVIRYDSVVTDDNGIRYVYTTGAWKYANGEPYYDSNAVQVNYSLLPNGDVYVGRYGDPGNIYPWFRMCANVGETWQTNSDIRHRMRNLGTEGILFDGRRWMGQQFEEYYYVPEVNGADTNAGRFGNRYTMIDSFGIVMVDDTDNGQVHVRVTAVVIGDRVYGKPRTSSVAQVPYESLCAVEMRSDGTLVSEDSESLRSIRVFSTLGQQVGAYTNMQEFNQAVVSRAHMHEHLAYVLVEFQRCRRTLLLIGGG